MRRVDPKECAVLIIDVQQKLAPAMPPEQLASLTRAATVLIEAARMLGAPVLVTEQYPSGLGHTIPAIAEKLSGAQVIEKLDFSACGAREFERALSKTGVRSAVVVGMETHICVFQTVRDLAARGMNVLVPLDGVASRREDHRQAGLDLCRAAGATVTTMETVVFDWLGRAGSDEFKKISKLIR